jgi:CBS domain-containing protein
VKISQIMKTDVEVCSLDDNLAAAASRMWDCDIGCLPVLDGTGQVVGMITDRDICMAAYIQGTPLWQIPVTTAMAGKVYVVSEGDSVDDVEALMRRVQVRRVPVLDGGGRLKGILSVNDLARRSHKSGLRLRKADGLSGDSIAKTLAAICEPRSAASQAEAAAS